MLCRFLAWWFPSWGVGVLGCEKAPHLLWLITGAGRSVLTGTIVQDALEHVENILGGKSVRLVEAPLDGVSFNLVIGQVKD